eukprot:COSAG01_NODE_1791_length_9221_cov_7.677373_3_plen_72_part_00
MGVWSILGGFICMMCWVAMMVPICDIPGSPYIDELTVAQAVTMYVKMEIRQRRVVASKEVRVSVPAASTSR